MVVLTSSRDRRYLELLRHSAARGFVEKERLSANALAELLA